MASVAPRPAPAPADISEIEVRPKTLEAAGGPTPDDSSSPLKPIHSLVLDTGPLIKGDPAVSTLLAQADELYTIPSVLSEVRDEQTRQRINTTLLPFLKLRSPKSESIKFVTDFARRTGDLEVLSRPDIHLIALTYELEVERNHGDWRLRKEPNQKRVNGRPPKNDIDTEEAPVTAKSVEGTNTETSQRAEPLASDTNSGESCEANGEAAGATHQDSSISAVADEPQKIHITPDSRGGRSPPEPTTELSKEQVSDKEAQDDSGDSDGEWITPSNIKKHQAKEMGIKDPEPIQRVLQACLLTSDFAMQNVSIRINLNVLSPNLSRITHLKSWVLRCHGCFTVTRKMDKQFCPSCGQATLTRTSCSTDSAGNFKIHLKRNFQWNNRGNVFSIPKPVHGNASGKLSGSGAQGGGKNGWGRELILAEDQKEYVKKVADDNRTRHKDLMDEDYLPSILTGDRTGGNGRIKVGAGRNVNARRR